MFLSIFATCFSILNEILENLGCIYNNVTTQHPMGISNRLTVVLQQELH